jgi:hypothetical protein
MAELRVDPGALAKRHSTEGPDAFEVAFAGPVQPVRLGLFP